MGVFISPPSCEAATQPPGTPFAAGWRDSFYRHEHDPGGCGAAPARGWLVLLPPQPLLDRHPHGGALGVPLEQPVQHERTDEAALAVRA